MPPRKKVQKKKQPQATPLKGVSRTVSIRRMPTRIPPSVKPVRLVRTRALSARPLKTVRPDAGAPTIPGRPRHFKTAYGSEFLDHPVHGRVERCWGHDHVTMVTVPAGEQTGTIYTNYQIGAGQTGGSSIAPATTHKRWIPNHIEYQYITALGNSTKGTYVSVIDPDPVSVWESKGAQNVARISASTGSVFKQFGEHDTTVMPPRTDQASLWCADTSINIRTPDDRLTYAGQYMLVCAVPTGLPEGTVIGMVRRWYDISYLVDTVSDVESSGTTSEIRVTGPAATAVRDAVIAGGGVIDSIINVAKNATAALSGVNFGGAVGIIREYQSLVVTKAAAVENTEGVLGAPIWSAAYGGFRTGNFSARLFIRSAANANPILSLSAWNVGGCDYAEGTTGGNVPFGSYIYDGTPYTGNTLTSDFGNNRDFASRDFTATFQTASLTAQLEFILILSIASNDSYLRINSVGEAKQASKARAVDAEPLPRPDGEFDFVDAERKASSGMRSAVPGGSEYKASAQIPRDPPTPPRSRRYIAVSMEPPPIESCHRVTGGCALPEASPPPPPAVGGWTTVRSPSKK